MSKPDSKKVVIVALGVLAVGVVFLLPRFVTEPLVKAPEEIETDTSSPQQVSPSRVAEKRQFREKAQKTLADIFAAREKLENIQVIQWRGEAFQQALDLITTGDQQYSVGEYEQSLESYSNSLTAMESLLSEGEALLAEAQDGVKTAIENGQVDKAQQYITTLNYLAPEDPEVVELTARVAQLPEVAAHLEQGKRFQAEGNLVEAEKAYSQALALDPRHREAARRLDQVRTSERQDRFSLEMGEGYRTMERGDYSQARKHFEEARRIDPGNETVGVALAQLENRRVQQQVAQQLAVARKLEAQENWQQAVEIYQQLNELDASLTEPRVRLIPAQARADLDARLQQLIAKPLALSQAPAGAQARQALKDARGISNPGPKLSGQIDQLSSLLVNSTLPVEVRFQSDNLTEVTLYRVGKLGTFDTKVMALKPGKYIVAGERKGYRDVQVEFTVSGGSPASDIVVRCTETI